MKIPEGYDEVINKEDCLILQKAICGLVRAARQFWKRIVDKMQEGGFQLSKADPCMFYKEDEKGFAICLEFKKMLDMGVWRHVKRNDCPNDHRLVGCKWVFKVKRNGVYHARLGAKGFSQIPGVDFTDNYSPVVNNVTFRVVVARMIIEI